MASRHDNAVAAAGIEGMIAVHGEELTLIPHNGSAKSITGIVARAPLTEQSQAGPGRRVAREVIIKRADHPELTLNGDKVDLKKQVDDSADTTMPATRLIRQSDAYWQLGVT